MNQQVIEQSTPINKRAVELNDRLAQLSDQQEDNFFDVCDLLHEAHEKSYHLDLGYVRFDDWIIAANIDMSVRQARYLINIESKTLRLGVSRELLKAVKISKMKEVFSLNPDEHSSAMVTLLEEAPNLTLDQVKAKVAALKTEAGEDVMLHMTIKYPESARQVIDEAFERCRRESGDYQTQQGDVVELSNGTVLERICAEFISGSNTTEDTVPEGLVEDDSQSV